jgi:hypothetical protein
MLRRFLAGAGNLPDREYENMADVMKGMGERAE